MKIITAGARYLDIDAYAGIIAYAELLQKQGTSAKAATSATPNESVPATVRSWPVELETNYAPAPEDTFTLIDVSVPDYFDEFVNVERVDRVIDHHPGLEKYWTDKIGDDATIEVVGAACTQVYECWQKAGLEPQISETSARLLMCGILDNTLNFGAAITTERDKTAYENLAAIADLPNDWPAQYFSEVQQAIDDDPTEAMQNDLKTLHAQTHEASIQAGQLVVWNAAKLLESWQDSLADTLEKTGEDWFINIISISEHKSYFLCKQPEMQIWLNSLLDVSFHGSLASANRMWLRKEILQKDIEKAAE